MKPSQDKLVGFSHLSKTRGRLKYFETAIDLNPPFPSSYFHICMLWLCCGLLSALIKATNLLVLSWFD